MIIQPLKFNIEPNILVRQLLNGVIFHLALNEPYLLLLGLLGSLFLKNFPQPFRCCEQLLLKLFCPQLIPCYPPLLGIWLAAALPCWAVRKLDTVYMVGGSRGIASGCKSLVTRQ